MARSRTPPPPPSGPPAGPPGGDMAAVARRIKQLERGDGQIVEEDVIDDARDPNSPLHSYFEWNEGRAAAQWRLLQARQLIRRVKFVVTVHRIDVTAPRYVKDHKNHRGYRDAEVIVLKGEKELARDTVVAEMWRVAAAVKRARICAISLDLEDELDALDELAAGLCRKLSREIETV